MRTGDLKFIAFASHFFNQNRNLQLTAALDDESICGIGIFQTHGHVFMHFPLQSLPDLAGCHIMSVLPGKRTVINREGHGNRRLINIHKGQRLHVLRITDAVPDVHIIDPGHADDLACQSRVNRAAVQALKNQHLADTESF